MGLTDILFGRKKLKEPAGDRLFAISTAAVTLDIDCGLKPAGVGAVIFKPLSAGEFTQASATSTSCCRRSRRRVGSTLDRKTDSFGFEWVIIHDPDLEDQVTAVHTVASELEAKRLRRPAARRRVPVRGREEPGLLDLRLQDGHLLAVRPDGREERARQRARAAS